MTTLVASEHQHQVSLIKWSELAMNVSPDLRELDLLFAIPNGGHRNKAVAAKLKAEGVRAGMPDLMLAVARGQHHGLFIEMKTYTGRTSDSQRDRIDALTAQGYKCIVAHGWEVARDELIKYLRSGE